MPQHSGPDRPRRFRRWRLARVVLLAAVAAVIAVRSWRHFGRPAEPDVLAAGVHRVERVVDGDTLLLHNGARVRLIGVDTPESVKPNHPVEPGAKQAAQFTREFLRAGSVELRFDRERRDRHGRFLAYAWVGDRMLNEELLRQGWGRALLKYNYSQSMKRRFRKAQQEAQQARRGIWE